MSNAPDTRLRARAAIYDYVLQFCITYGRDVEDNRPRSGSTCGFVHRWTDREGQVGDLIILQSAPQSKWRIGWLREMREQNKGWPEYLVESLDDGEQCWWSNVGISYMERDKLQHHPEWRWTDRQFALSDRWRRVAYKENDAYIDLPTGPRFGQDDEHSVTIGMRTRHSFDDIVVERTFPDWRKVTLKTLRAAWADMLAEKNAQREQRKVEREASEAAAKEGAAP